MFHFHYIPYFPVPGPVFDLHMAEVSATFVRIGWKKPQQPNGIITQYRVKVSLEDTGETLEDTILTEKIKVLTDLLLTDFLCIHFIMYTYTPSFHLPPWRSPDWLEEKVSCPSPAVRDASLCPHTSSLPGQQVRSPLLVWRHCGVAEASLGP